MKLAKIHIRNLLWLVLVVVPAATLAIGWAIDHRRLIALWHDESVKKQQLQRLAFECIEEVESLRRGITDHGLESRRIRRGLFEVISKPVAETDR